MAYLAANLAQRITVADLAATVRLHPSHFARLFKRSLGDSPMRFVAAYRLDQARRQLSRPEARLKDVAHDCGFADQAHLSRAFRQHFGESPSTYRQAPR
jgi:AraC family transcriptional regulator